MDAHPRHAGAVRVWNCEVFVSGDTVLRGSSLGAFMQPLPVGISSHSMAADNPLIVSLSLLSLGIGIMLPMVTPWPSFNREVGGLCNQENDILVYG